MSVISIPAQVTLNPDDIPEKIVINAVPKFWKTQAQLVNNMAVNSANPPANMYQIYRINLGPVEVGDVFDVSSHHEFTNDAFNGSIFIPVSLVSGVVMNTNQNALWNAPGNVEVCCFTGPNVEQVNPHHAPIQKSGHIEITEAIKTQFGNADVYLIYIAWAVTDYVVNGAIVNVHPGYPAGQMTAIRHRRIVPESEVQLPDGIAGTIATQAQAVAGTDNATLMTPLRTAQAIAASSSNASLASGGITPTVRGSTTAGTATYTVQQGAWENRIDSNKVDFWMRVAYSGANGTGQMFIGGLPFNASGYMPVLVYQDGVPPGAGNELTANVVPGTNVVALYRSSQTGGASSLPVDAAGDITIAGFYFKQT